MKRKTYPRKITAPRFRREIEPLETRTLLSAVVASTPYNGSPVVAGQTIEAENFDLGGQGVAYSVKTTGSMSVDAYRPGEKVDIDAGGTNGFHVGELSAGSWLQYTISIPVTGKYVVDTRYSAPVAGATLHFSFDSKVNTSTVTTGKTGSYTSWHTAISNVVSLTQGVHVMRVLIDHNVTGQSFAADLDWFNLTQSAPSPTSFTWKAAAKAPVNSFEGMSATVNGKLYMFGGFSSVNPWGVNDVYEVYDPGTNVWTSLGKMPIPETHCGVAVDQDTGIIYFVGGYRGNYPGLATSDVYSYDVNTNTWTTLPSLPVAAAAGEAVLLNGVLHYFGGTHGTDRETDYADQWTLNLTQLAAQTAAGTGTSNTAAVTHSDSTDPDPGTGDDPTGNPTGTDPGTGGDPTGTDPGTGGDPTGTDPGTGGDPTGTDPGTGGDPTGTDPGTGGDPTGTGGDPTGTDPGTGGDPTGTDPGNPTPPPAPVTWQTDTPLPEIRDHASAIVDNGKIYVLGGEIGHETLHLQQTDTFVFDPGTDAWSTLAPIPVPRSHDEDSTFIRNGMIIMAGGQIDDSQSANNILEYDPAADRWSLLPATLPGVLQGAVVQPWNNELIVSVGYDDMTAPTNKTWTAQWPAAAQTPAPITAPVTTPVTTPITPPVIPPAPPPAPPPVPVDKPFLGTPFNVGQVIEAENYDSGGEGISYHDTTAANLGGSKYRSDGVDVQAGPSNGNEIGYTAAGEWLNYTITIPKTGQYVLSASVACTNSGATFHAQFDGGVSTPSMTVPNTGSWQKFQTVTSKPVTLTAGTHVMRILIDRNATGIPAAGNYDWFKLAASS